MNEDSEVLPYELAEGVATFTLSSWSQFYSLVETDLVPWHQGWKDVVWRGQRRHDWPLNSSFDRIFEEALLTAEEGSANADELLHLHLDRFKMAVRGRRGINPPVLSTENDWWALGQHYGLATPLLDWTSSPFAAAYFAFEDESIDLSEFRVVYGLHRGAVILRNSQIEEGAVVESGRAPTLEFIDPYSDENPRLVAQGGLFTRAPLGVPVERWITANFEEAPEPVLYRILIPCGDRRACLRALNRMNINHLSLFPDLAGASRHVNLALAGAL